MTNYALSVTVVTNYASLESQLWQTMHHQSHSCNKLCIISVTVMTNCASSGIVLIFCAAWVAISKHGIIGPFWFANAIQEPVTVRKERYIVVLNKLWGVLALLSRGRGRNRVQRDIQWFQQDGAPPHTANITLDWLDHKFPNRLIRRKREPEWSPHSRDLNPLDFYL